VSQPLQLALLCYLALARPRGLQPREGVIALLWPGYDSARGHRALRNALHGIRKRLGHRAIVSTGDHLIGLNPAVVSCDAHDMERGMVPADAAWTDETVEPLHGLYVNGALEFDHWLSNERSRLKGLLRRHASAPSARPPSGTEPRQLYSPDAWVMHARGHYLFLRSAHGGPAEELLLCREYFERALDLDPTFSPAVAGLSNFYAVAARRGVLAPFREHFGRAIALSEQALAMDPTLAVPHVHFGVQALYLDDDLPRAGAEFSIAVQKDPSYAEGHRFLGVWLGMTRRHDEALRHMERAVALEPDIPHFLSSLGAARLAAGDRDGAEEALRRTLLLEPRHTAARERLIRLLDESGRQSDAVVERERPPALPEAPMLRAALNEGPDAYTRAVRDLLVLEAEALESRVRTSREESVADIFSPPTVRLVSLYARAGELKRARSWELQSKALRPGLVHWFSALPELPSNGRP
jgi:DNA-binding SARP family transcriptional activator